MTQQMMVKQLEIYVKRKNEGTDLYILQET